MSIRLGVGRLGPHPTTIDTHTYTNQAVVVFFSLSPWYRIQSAGGLVRYSQTSFSRSACIRAALRLSSLLTIFCCWGGREGRHRKIKCQMHKQHDNDTKQSLGKHNTHHILRLLGLAEELAIVIVITPSVAADSAAVNKVLVDATTNG